MILVIAEKPSVAQTIAAVLGAKEKKDGFLTGSGYLVSWCVGHLGGLSKLSAGSGYNIKSGAMTAYRFCRRNGNTPLPLTRKSNSRP